ncbi:MAG: URC4/urg3 family protein [Bdellovibrionales bacterium]|nr:URC4/urg3 family protein [Bdellovibrionales bacterium]
MPGTSADVEHLFNPTTIRAQAAKIRALADAGHTHFSVHPEKMDEVAQFVAEVTRENYPELDIPFHSRWSHFQAGKIDRLMQLESALAVLSPQEQVRAKIDLVIVSVLLDAGSGPGWTYTEASGTKIARSEGLAVASLHMFLNGDFSSDPQNKLRVDAQRLASLGEGILARGFQVTPQNPLAGFSGRLGLLRSLGDLLQSDNEYFPSGRLGDLVGLCTRRARDGILPAAEILNVLQTRLGSIWPGRVFMAGVNLGDVWPYAPLGKDLPGLVPFHKLSQWLTYSLVAPLEQSGLRVGGFDALTALAEYRNGGLLVDTGLIQLRQPALAEKAHEVSSELVIEWRALTVNLLEEVAQRVRQILGRTAEQLPLGKVLEGGTWWAGRKVAARLRADGSPPLKIKSDGTVF